MWHVVKRIGPYEILEGAGVVAGLWAVSRRRRIERTYENRVDAEEHAHQELGE
jgi:hypothetical protein